MPRIYQATFQPFTYEELATPLREATAAHQKVEEDYNNNMLVVDSLRQRAASELETNPESKWAAGILNYADQLEQYAGDLARNGLTRQTRNDLLNMKRGYGTQVSPVLMAMQREKELQTVRDKAAGTNMVFGRMPSLDEIIANPNISQSAYNGDDLYKKAQDTASAFSKRNIQLIKPQNIDAYRYQYGKQHGFTNEQIDYILNNEPEFAKMFGSIVEQSGFDKDSNLDDSQRNKLFNSIMAGALSGFDYDIDMHYANRPDDPMYYLKLQEQRNKNPQGGYGTGNQLPQIKRPTLLFGHSVDPKSQIRNDELKNKIINNKSIVTNISHGVNGDEYDISNDYIQNLITSMNNNKYTKRLENEDDLIYTVYRDLNGNEIDVPKLQKDAKQFGITGSDSVESAKKKINKFLNNVSDYTDLSDATLHTSMQVQFDPSEYNKVRDKYDGIDGNLNILTKTRDGRWVDSGDKLKNPDKYDPIRVEIGLDGIYQIWKKSKSDDKGDDIIKTPFFSASYGQQILNDYMSDNGGTIGLTKEYNRRNNLEAETIRNTIDYNINQFDDKMLKDATGLTKGNILQRIKSMPNTIGSNRDLVEYINNIEQRYYKYVSDVMYDMYQNGYESDEILNQYNLSKTRLKNVNDKIQLLNDFIDEIDESASIINDNIVDIIGVTNKRKPQEVE